MTIKEKQIIEIAELLDTGMICFYHRPTGRIDSHPDPNDPYFDPEPWQDVIDRIENEWGNYERIEKMESFESYRVIENFAYSLADESFKKKILNAISKRKPFRNFKNLIDYSDYRQNWFDFKNKAYIDFVKRQVETIKK
ncbi:hypothetical protein E1176_09455 [Fulvivirga sp. RKSG066]|uniref:UPF0158 family protein n=1 Tax=Fulvivirga aurantia TaxID=2529383 RepID=UPI0012BC21CA|nr:UPF0158 family protein [Fulvivirga aurantia]MTI21245.1 hypothetical protein [Fulvivirga aurantia]